MVTAAALTFNPLAVLLTAFVIVSAAVRARYDKQEIIDGRVLR
jgi:hypothetical protein